MGEGVVVRPNQWVAGGAGLGGARDAVDEAVGVWGARETLGRRGVRARSQVSDGGVVPFFGRRLRRGRDQGHRVVGSVGLLERGLDGGDRVVDHSGP